MRSILSFVFLICFFISKGQTYKPSVQSSSVKFAIKMLGSEVVGTISGLDGTIKFDPNALSTSSMEVKVDVASINTGVEMRDEHLRKEEFFNVSQYPAIQFISSKIVKANRKNTWFVYGTLKIKGVSREVSFPFTAITTDSGYWLNGQFRINRRDYNVGESSMTLSDNVVITLNVKIEKS